MPGASRIWVTSPTVAAPRVPLASSKKDSRGEELLEVELGADPPPELQSGSTIIFLLYSLL